VTAVLEGAKEIRRFKVAINTACPLRCEYCFIDKDSGEVLSWPSVEASVRLLLQSSGKVKKLLIYGGEPFLRFDLVRKIAAYARSEAAAAGKELDLSICTSGVGVKREHLEFLHEHRFFLSVSLDGDAATHDRRRVLKGGAGSWGLASAALPEVFEVMGRRRTMAIQCVHPDNVERMLDNFQTLVGLGFENVEIEVIHGFGWAEKKALFRPMLNRVLDWILSEAREGRFRFLVCSLVPLMLGSDGVRKEDGCPFHSSMECYPDGNYSFYPFAFVDAEGRRRSSVGSTESGVIEKYRSCTFDAASDQCRGCMSDYYRDPRVNEGNEAYLWRTQFARAFMEKVAWAARTDPVMRAYLKEALLRCRIS
jgi:sulfatase maturation enzyme AslB (radical SAM superfamily)